ALGLDIRAWLLHLAIENDFVVRSGTAIADIALRVERQRVEAKAVVVFLSPLSHDDASDARLWPYLRVRFDDVLPSTDEFFPVNACALPHTRSFVPLDDGNQHSQGSTDRAQLFHLVVG